MLRLKRLVRQAPWHTLGGIVTFGLGVGMNLAIFAVVDRVLFRPLPYAEPSRLVTVHPVNPKTQQVYFAFPRELAVYVRARREVVADLAFAGNSRNYYPDGPEGRALRLTDASFNVLTVLGVRPAAGRPFTEADAKSGNRFALLRAEIWRSAYAGRAEIVGAFLNDPKGSIEVVGILPAGFIVPSVNWATPSDGLILSPELLQSGKSGGSVPAPFARLSQGVSVQAAQQAFDNAARRLESANVITTAAKVKVEPIQEGLFWNCRGSLALLFSGGILVWLISAVNLGALLTARWRSREPQVAIMRCIGASAGSIGRAVLVETAVLCALGAGVAVVGLWLSLGTIRAVTPAFIESSVLQGSDPRLFVFTILASVLGVFVAGVGPALRAMKVTANDALIGDAQWKYPSRLNRGILVAEAAVCTLLLLAAGLTLKSLVGLVRTDLGYEVERLHAGGVRLPRNASGQFPAVLAGDVVLALRANSSVDEATAVDASPIGGEGGTVIADAEGRRLALRKVADHYFETLRTPMVAGRAFTSTEVASSSAVTVVSSSALRLLLPAVEPRDAIGRTVELAKEGLRQIVGVVKDTRGRHALAPIPEVFVPSGLLEAPVVTFLVRAKTDSFDYRQAGERVAQTVGVPLTLPLLPAVRRLDPWLEDPKLFAVVFGAFGALGLALATTGLFAVTMFDVATRRREMGLRLAMGATPRQLRLMVTRQAVAPVAVGALLGLLLAFWLANLLQALLHETDARAIGSYALASLVLVLSAGVAAWFPARHAGRQDPSSLLRAR